MINQIRRLNALRKLFNAYYLKKAKTLGLIDYYEDGDMVKIAVGVFVLVLIVGILKRYVGHKGD